MTWARRLSLLFGVLVLVGMGWLLREPAEAPRPKPPPRPEVPAPEPLPPPLEVEVPADATFSAGFIGGACEADGDCPFDGGLCLTTADGFPRGHCTRGCETVCPDAPGVTRAPTFCTERAVGVAGELARGFCVARCNLALTSTGCRPGYVCTSLPRLAGDADEVRLGCLPDLGTPPPSTACTERLDAAGIVYARPDLADDPTRPGASGGPRPKEAICQLDTPVLLAVPIEGVDHRNKAIAYPEPILVACDFAEPIVALSRLLSEHGVVEAEHVGTYVCRSVAGSRTLSGHGRGLAIDITAFERTSGTPVRVIDHWSKGSREKRRWLRGLVRDLKAAKLFDVVLTPASNAAHLDHLHLEVKPKPTE